MSFGLDSAESTNTLLIFLVSLDIYINIAVRHLQSFTPAKGSPEFYCDELKGWVKGNLSKFEVMSRRRWTLLLRGGLQLWKMWTSQRVYYPNDQEPTSSSRLNATGNMQLVL